MGEEGKNSNNGKFSETFKESSGKASFSRTVAWACFIWNLACAFAFTLRILISAVVAETGLKFGDVPPELFKYNIYLFGATVLAYGFNKLGIKINGK